MDEGAVKAIEQSPSQINKNSIRESLLSSTDLVKKGPAKLPQPYSRTKVV
jgi:hypothetical protein